MNQSIDRASKSRILEKTWLFLLTLLATIGFLLIILGTGASTVDRYLAPPQILPGLGVLYICAVLTAFVVVRQSSSSIFSARLRAFVATRIGESERKAQRNGFVLLTMLTITFAMTHGTTPMYRALATNYSASLFINLLVSTISAIGLFGWLSSLFLSKSKGK